MLCPQGRDFIICYVTRVGILIICDVPREAILTINDFLLGRDFACTYLIKT